ncbi:LPS translocon maturation chaperone LptM [Noviherbaspirillum aridicola]|uniref:LPS translocon maturation chaperone LptM n=1 Tax=Noviherbaspirillum aridicola TaxID=2849687 RepID=UPI001C802C06|nr:lipoprotein [Noviherbaspirillum aridicola]
MKPAFHLPLLTVLICLLAACGQKGPLYLPAKPAPVANPGPRVSPPPAPSTPEAAEPAPASR